MFIAKHTQVARGTFDVLINDVMGDQFGTAALAWDFVLDLMEEREDEFDAESYNSAVQNVINRDQTKAGVVIVQSLEGSDKDQTGTLHVFGVLNASL